MMKNINREDVLYYLKQNGFKVAEQEREGIIKVKAYNAEYKVYLEVMCCKCGAPLMALDDEEEIDVCCTNRFCSCF